MSSRQSQLRYDAYAHYGRRLIECYHEQQKSKLPPTNPHLVSLACGLIPKSSVALSTPCRDIVPVGILGGGVGGLYTALILDSLGIQYEILEASRRTGGRLFTHKFPTGGRYDYFDVGAMRFPDINIMTRLFHLFAYLNLSASVVPYYMTAKENNGYLLYNNVRMRQNALPTGDAFKAGNIGVDASYICAGHQNIVNDVIKPFVTALKQDLSDGGTAGWDMIRANDAYSLRAYMSFKYIPDPKLQIPVVSLPTEVVNWCETMGDSTGGYDRALSEIVLDALAFEQTNLEWKCIDGGSQVLSDSMTTLINAKNNQALLFDQHVISIAPAIPKNPSSAMNVTVTSNCGKAIRTYSHIISTLPLSCLRAVDISQCYLTPMQSNALRELTSGPGVKVGIQFKSAWWADKTHQDLDGQPINIVGGQSSTDRPIRNVVYPSYGIGQTPVLIASYLWLDDAPPLGALIGTANANVEKQLIDLVMRDLAAVHNVSIDMLYQQYVDHYSFDWTHNPLSIGACAFYGPGKFGDIYTSLNTPAANGRLHFAGEAISVRHAWVVGALDSAWRAVKEMLVLTNPTLLPKFYELWGTNEEWTKPTQNPQALFGGPVSVQNDLLLEHLVLNCPELFVI